MDIRDYKELTKWLKELDGVLCTSDIKTILNTSKASLYRGIHSLIESGDLIKVKAGIYASSDANLSDIATRIYPKSYISTGTILAAKGLIGSIPKRKVQIVTVGTPRTFSCKLGTIESLSISKKLFFGFEKVKNSYWATAEKAYIDCCYFFYKRKQFSFNLQTDVNLELLNNKIIESYIKKYDARFISYFKKNFWQNK